MQIFDAKNDYEYFARLWGMDEPKDNKKTNWDDRAGSWGFLLESESAFKRSLHERVAKTSNFLRERGLLGPGDAVADVGCGTGRFTSEFATTAGHVTGIDISEKMLDLARRHAAESGITNTSYILRDFTETDVDAEGWTGGFDLVFTSITGAVSGVSNLNKIMRMSRAYCFNSSFIRNRDDLEKRVAGEVFGIDPNPALGAGGSPFYSLFNLLWLDGYYPETCYHKQRHDNMVPADDELAEYYAWSIFRKPVADGEVKSLIKGYLLKNATQDGMIRQYTERWYGWILWDIREKDERR